MCSVGLKLKDEDEKKAILDPDQARLFVASCLMSQSADPTQKKRGTTMLNRQVKVASVLAVVLISLSGPAARAQGGATLSHCKADAERICPGVTPGGGKLIECLKQHTDDVSVSCAKALKAVKTKMGK
jgi:hypothetical protein